MEYRKKWKKVNGTIPKDEEGRAFEIHHVDGDRNNNNIENLKCLSIREHYELHLLQEDFAAAFRIAQRMSISTEEKSRLMSLSNKKRIAEGNHPFINKEVREKVLKTITKQLEEGTHPFLNKKEEWQQRANLTYAKTHDRKKKVKEGWVEYKLKNPNHTRTLPGAIAGAAKTKGTKWFHKLDGTHLRTTEDDIRLKEGWIPGRFKLNLSN